MAGPPLLSDPPEIVERKILAMRYVPPRFVVHGSIESLTAILDGGSYCGGADKQVGVSDLINGQVSVGTCTASSA